MEALLRKLVWLFRERAPAALPSASVGARGASDASGSSILRVILRTAGRSGLLAAAVLGAAVVGGAVYYLHTRSQRAGLMTFPSGVAPVRALSLAITHAYTQGLARRLIFPLRLSPAAEATMTEPAMRLIISRGLPFLTMVVDDAAAAIKSAAVHTHTRGGASATGASAVGVEGPIGIAGTGFSARDAFADVVRSPSASSAAFSLFAHTHVCVMNRSPVAKEHVVAVATDYQAQDGTSRMPSQDAPMDERDMRSLWFLVKEAEGLGFYNCGPASGGSQPRRHVQFIPSSALRELLRTAVDAWKGAGESVRVRVGEDDGRLLQDMTDGVAARTGVPLDACVSAWARDRQFRCDTSCVHTLPLPFAHGFAWLGDDVHHKGYDAAGASLWATYVQLLAAVTNGGVTAFEAAEASAGKRPWTGGSHNVLLTRKWMLVVPRTASDVSVPLSDGARATISMNSMAYAGMMLVRYKDRSAYTSSELAHWLTAGSVPPLP